MSTVDNRIMKFLDRKEAQFPELKQPSVVLYEDLMDEQAAEASTMGREEKTFRRAVRNPFYRRLHAA